MQNYKIDIQANTSNAVEEINKLTLAVDKLVKKCKPKWYEVHKWFSPIVININLEEVIKYKDS